MNVKELLLILIFAIIGISLCYGVLSYKYSVDNPMCSMSINFSADLNEERLGFEEFASNVRIEGISLTAPCGSDGIVNLYKLQYGGR